MATPIKDPVQVIKDNLEALIAMFGTQLIDNKDCICQQAMCATMLGLLKQIYGKDGSQEYEAELREKFPTVAHLLIR